MSELMMARTDIVSGAMTFMEYQTNPAAAVLYDDPAAAASIRGVNASAYLLGGLYEEYAETLEFDAVPPAYSRIGMIALRSGHNLIGTYQEDARQLERHRKEFGDLLWYCAALLHRAGTGLPHATGLTTFAELDELAGCYAQATPYALYKNSFKRYARSAADTLFKGHDTFAMEKDACELLGIMAWIACDRLGTSLDGIAKGNIRKLTIRHRDNTIFGSGDDR